MSTTLRSERLGVAIYARCSTTDQNPEMQLHELRGLAERNGWQVFREYIDVGHSGAKQSRPALDELMADANHKRFNFVLVWKFDRFARSVSHLVRALEMFNELGVGFVSYTENLDTSTSMGRCTFSIIGAMAQLERDLISERTSCAVRLRISKGQHWGRRSTVDVPRAKKLQGRGLSLGQIAASMNVSKSALHRALRA